MGIFVVGLGPPITKTYATGLTVVTNFNTNGTVANFTDRIGQSTTYA